MQCSLLAPDPFTMVFNLLSLRRYCCRFVGDLTLIGSSLSWDSLTAAFPDSMIKHNRNTLVAVGDTTSLSAPIGLYHVTEPSWHVTLALRTPGGRSISSLEKRTPRVLILDNVTHFAKIVPSTVVLGGPRGRVGKVAGFQRS